MLESCQWLGDRVLIAIGEELKGTRGEVHSFFVFRNITEKEGYDGPVVLH